MAKTAVALLLLVSGCTSTYCITPRINEIEKKHNVTITVNSSSNQAGVCDLLDRIDKDLEICPKYFKENIGPIIIEDSFDEIGLKGVFLIGYVDSADFWDDYPIHIKNRSILEKILFFTPREKDVFLHEASHSFELNLKAEISNKWQRFYEEFNRVQVREYDSAVLLWHALLPITPKPHSMPSFYSGANHFEDFAETHCYLRRNNIELIKDPALYKKCKIVERFVISGDIDGNSRAIYKPLQPSK